VTIPLARKQVLGYIVAVIVIAAATAVLKVSGVHINPTTVALSFLLIVLFVAAAWGSKPAVLAALVGGICFNFFFLPPFGSFHIAEPENWIAFIAFVVTAITAGQLSARARRRAEEADAARREIERLYRELQESFEEASQARALKQSERLKSALLDAVTHDLRTPLTSIKASVTTLLDDQRATKTGEGSALLGEGERREMLEVIDEESDRLDRFINGMMELARIEAGEMQLRRRWGPIEEIISAALSRANSLTDGHPVEFDIEAELPAVRVDARAVSEVVYSLVDNAAKYSPEGAAIRITAHRHGDGLIQMSVEDDGEGIGVQLRERVFDKFFRATRDGDVSTRRPQGTGMGLAIARGIVEAHDGKIWIETGHGGKGTRVIFTLPIGDEETPPPSSLEED
jgi:two-component system sensor histidine kinase KdpD